MDASTFVDAIAAAIIVAFAAYVFNSLFIVYRRATVVVLFGQDNDNDNGYFNVTNKRQDIEDCGVEFGDRELEIRNAPGRKTKNIPTAGAENFNVYDRPNTNDERRVVVKETIIWFGRTRRRVILNRKFNQVGRV